ncbi:hypothetical protein PZC41_14430, partial [Staphylococcus aureus]|uniref:hypothetical protein n=1 Tax=Staphylococcus aureus TaxID=1280 RepID=UPI0023B0C357
QAQQKEYADDLLHLELDLQKSKQELTVSITAATIAGTIDGKNAEIRAAQARELFPALTMNVEALTEQVEIAKHNLKYAAEMVAMDRFELRVYELAAQMDDEPFQLQQDQ